MFSIKTQIRKKFIGTDSRSKKMYKNTVAMIGIRGVSMILTLISAPIMLHHVDRADYGVLLTLTSIVGWVGYMDVGLGNGLRNKLPEFLAKEGEVMGNEVDFMVHGYVPLNIFGHEVWLTTTHVCLLIVCLFMLVIGLIVNNKMKHATEVPGMVQNIAELYVEMMDGVVQSSMFRHWGKYANYILTIFMFLLFSNISGLFGLRPPTADYGVTLPLALITFVLIQFNAFKWKGVGGYVKDLMDPIPLFLPINIISEFATPVSLSLRLFGNVMAGTIMLALYYGMLPVLATVVIPSFLHAYLDLFSGAIQAYVFCMLSMTFIYQKMPE